MILIFLLLFNAHAAAPCDGAQVGYWTNPDGSRGGWVAKTAQVERQVFVGPEVQICDGAQVRGTSRVFGRAKVSGKSVVRNAIICQASQINGFDVVDSDYYCQTEDPEPPHPGELGKKTLLGVDSDRDGVRDDVEVWINDKFSNTPLEEKRFERLAFKEKSRFYQLIIKDRAVRGSVRSKYIQLIGVQDCIYILYLNDAFGSKNRTKVLKEKMTNRKELFEKTFNTRKRVVAWEEVLKHLGGLKLESSFKERSQCETYLNSLK